MKKMLKMLICAMLTATMSVGILAGCKTGSGGSTGDQGTVQSGNSNVPTVSESTSDTFSSENDMVLKADGKEYFGDVTMNSDGTLTRTSFKAVNSTDELEIGTDGTGYYNYVGTEGAVEDGKVYYCRYKDLYDGICVFDFSNSTEITRTILMNREEIRSSLPGEAYSDAMDVILESAEHLQVDGDYVYFNYVPSAEYCFDKNFKQYNYRLGRFKKDGSSVELLGNEVCYDYVIKNGWIYYFDNGLDFSTEKDYQSDQSRIGIYKMKIDGSEKQKLLDGFQYYENPLDKMVADMKIYGDYLYFEDLTEKGGSKVYRMKTDGSDVTMMTKSGVYNYVVSGDNLYFSKGERKWSATTLDFALYTVPLSGGEEEEVFKAIEVNTVDFGVDGDYIYLYGEPYQVKKIGEKVNETSGNTDSSESEEPEESNEYGSFDGLCGRRYSLKENKMENLNGICRYQYEENEEWDTEVIVPDSYSEEYDWEDAQMDDKGYYQLVLN